MMFKESVVLMALVASASAFAPTPIAFRPSMSLAANIMDTAVSLKGPAVVWGSEGVMVGKEENEVKGYDNFSAFVNAVNAAGLGDALKGPGPFTVFAPTDSAFAAYSKPLTAEVLKYHVVPGKYTASAISGDLPTLNGKALMYQRKFRKTFVDDAIVGQEDNFGGGSSFPVDIACDNGIIHAISTVLDPSFAAVGAEAGLGGVQ